jgi:hypothetical protein
MDIQKNGQTLSQAVFGRSDKMSVEWMLKKDGQTLSQPVYYRSYKVTVERF